MAGHKIDSYSDSKRIHPLYMAENWLHTVSWVTGNKMIDSFGLPSSTVKNFDIIAINKFCGNSRASILPHHPPHYLILPVAVI
ncbi:unnamed protein product [Absidia cylindrospora]